MLSIAKENSILLNDEYLEYQQSITHIQQRLEKDVQLLGFDLQDQQDALEYAADRVTLFRFLKDSDFSQDAAVERLLDTIQWRKIQKVGRMTYKSTAPEFFDEGFAFFHKQDLLGRPVAVIQMRHFPKFKESNKSLSDFMQPFACLVMEIARQLTRDLTRKNEEDHITDKPVLISQISIIIDIQKAPFVPIDSSLMHNLKNVTNTRFPGFVGSVYIMNFGWMYQGIWQVVKLVLSEQAKARVNFISNSEISQVVDERDCLRVLGGKDDYVWSLDSDLILDLYATENRFEIKAATARSSRSSSVSSISSSDSSIFFDAPAYLSRQNSVHSGIIQSAYTSSCPSIYGTPGALTPINSYLTNRQQQLVRQYPLEPRYFLNGFRMGDTFLTSFFRSGTSAPSNNSTLDGFDLSNRLLQLLSPEEMQQLDGVGVDVDDDDVDVDGFMDTADLLLNTQHPLMHFPHMLPDGHPQSVYMISPVKHQLVRAEQRVLRLARKLFRLSFAYKGAVYWVVLYLFLRGPVEDTFKKTLSKLLAGTSQEQIAYTAVGVTATVAAALSTSLSNSIHNNNKHIDR
ncbi:CRAL-TRIO domain-containing protein [Parasitella parasitica]|nr:CRAL-TRIO domain-containing protein [Parasitella parasitica]